MALPPSFGDLSSPKRGALPPSFGDLSGQQPPSVGDLSSQLPGSGQSLAGGHAAGRPSANDVLRVFNRGGNRPVEKPNVAGNTDRLGALQEELESQKKEYKMEFGKLRNELHSSMNCIKDEFFTAMESLRKVGSMTAPQSSSTASKDDLKQMQGNLQQRLQDDLQTVSSRIVEVQSSVQSSLDGYAKCLSQSGKLQESQFEKFHARLSKLEQSPHSVSAGTDRLSQSLPHDMLQGRTSQPQRGLPNIEELSPSSFLEQLRRDAAILPENILDCSERPLTPRSMAANADRLSQSLPLNHNLTEAEMQGRANARAEFMGGPATSMPSGYNPNPPTLSMDLPVTANTDRLCHSLPAPESPRNIWAADPPSPRSRSARAESPRQVWSSDLPPSPRQKSK